ncbi:MAG TPA: DUF3160 domain-containing protein, partial [Rhodothermales bacterium]|nr:DUF3160 domain-containing protein [Rhodothermales bacterium]
MSILYRLARPIIPFIGLFLGIHGWVQAQSAPPLDVSAYHAYFVQHADMTAADLLAEYDAGLFSREARNDFLASNFAAEQQALFGFTPDEIDLVSRNGFAVSERLTYPSFGRAFVDIFVNDLPVYVSSDAVLHAIHMSYDNILQDVEREVLIPRLETALSSMHGALPGLAAQYASSPEVTQMLRDADVYLTVPMLLLGMHPDPVYKSNTETIDDLLDFVAGEAPVDIALFAETPRNVDFSQFTPRGHYADEEVLRRYFQAMMWIGRIEIYLIAPENTFPPPTDADIRRQIVLTKLLTELAAQPDAAAAVDDIDRILRTMVGDSDNVTLANVRSVFDEAGVATADQLLAESVWKDFQTRLAEKPFAFQKILSQILISDDPDSSQIESASAFLLLGQRFIIDSYVTGSVVFDKIKYEGVNVRRMMPSTLDVLFALGNDGAAQFLEEELNRYHYAPYLASLRYLIDSYDDAFWSRSMYNGWLNAIRQLSPPEDRSALPAFMQTAQWSQKQMTTQLASWAQLRHDNLLYAKPSYTAGLGCLFPESLVEPVPTFFEAVRTFADQASVTLSAVLPEELPVRSGAVAYFTETAATMEKLRDLAQKEIDGVPFSDED